MVNQFLQLPLGLSIKDEDTFENFYSIRNQEVHAELKKAAGGEGEKIIYLCGGNNLGISHLLKASCHYAHSKNLRSVYLPLAQHSTFTPEILLGLESLDLIAIDDLQAIVGEGSWEEALFYLYNRVHEKGGRIVIAAHDLPQKLGLKLPDLVSRLSWGMTYQIHPLSDEEKLYVLTMRAKRRGLDLSEEVGNYLITHCPRNLSKLFHLLDVLDKATLAAQRRLTIPFLKEVLQIK